LALSCYACQSAPPEPVLLQDPAIGFCQDCLKKRRLRQGQWGLFVLSVVWLLCGWYLLGVIERTDLDIYWRSARLLPALLISIYASIFVVRSVWFLLANKGLNTIAQDWAVDIATRLRNQHLS